MDGSGSNGEHNVWSVLANTERWIAKTLDDASKTSLPTGSDSDSDNGGSGKGPVPPPHHHLSLLLLLPLLLSFFRFQHRPQHQLSS
mmetsp:Transcript_28799/g.69740  ORF Transcript_28799/g.69740 Transcript_28799/m.69740 type:complete len:86 (-) Transcript_28799:170-427(-)